MWLCNDADDGNDNDDDYNNNNMKSVAIIKYKSLEQKKRGNEKTNCKMQSNGKRKPIRNKHLWCNNEASEQWQHK